MIKNNIESYRKKYKITQKKLAVELGVSRQTIYAIENYKYNPSLELALKISEYFKVKVEDIFILQEGDNEKI